MMNLYHSDVRILVLSAAVGITNSSINELKIVNPLTGKNIISCGTLSSFGFRPDLSRATRFLVVT